MEDKIRYTIPQDVKLSSDEQRVLDAVTDQPDKRALTCEQIADKVGTSIAAASAVASALYKKGVLTRRVRQVDHLKVVDVYLLFPHLYTDQHVDRDDDEPRDFSPAKVRAKFLAYKKAHPPEWPLL